MKSKNWYYEVNDYCKTLLEVYNIPLIKVSGIMSALSPNNTFRNNVKSLEKFLRNNGNCKVTTFNIQKQKALKILRSCDKISVDEVKKILGNSKNNSLKTKAFFDNIYRPEKSKEVTIDLWMVRWAKIEGSLTPKKYRQVSTKIKNMADNIGVMPHELQAKIWVDIRKKAF